MSALPQRKPYYSVEEYFRIDEDTEYRNEYYRGEIFAMSGGTANHNRIAGNIFGELYSKLANGPCEAFISDLRILVERAELYTYPDVAVVCGPLKFVEGRTDTITNPIVIVEVLSPSTESYDRGKKFEFYRGLDTLRDYVLIDQDRLYVEHFSHAGDRQWMLRVFDDAADVLDLESIGVQIALSTIYQRVAWED